MKISVVVPVFNDVLHIRDCLESIIKQNYFDTEILVFDAGSTDGTLAILKEYKRFFAFFSVATRQWSGRSAQLGSEKVRNWRYFLLVEFRRYA